MNKTRRQALTLLGSTALFGGLASHATSQDEPDPFEGGIGGTGIVGTVYGAGALSVNGLGVDVTTRTAIRSAFGRVNTASLAPGQVLTIEAQKDRSGIKARDIFIDYALVGTLQQNGASASVNGVPLVDWRSALGQGQAGQRVAVSGVWTPSGVRPNRIDAAPAGPDLIAGTFNGRQIGGVTLATGATLPDRGSYTVALGQAGDGGFDVERFRTGRFATFSGLRLLSVDGYLEPTRNAPGFRIAGLGHSFARNAELSQIGGRRAIYFGPYSGRFDARVGYIVPDRYTARQRALRDGYGPSSGLQSVRI